MSTDDKVKQAAKVLASHFGNKNENKEDTTLLSVENITAEGKNGTLVLTELPGVIFATINHKFAHLAPIVAKAYNEREQSTSIVSELLEALKKIEMKSWQKDEWAEMAEVNKISRLAIDKANKYLKQVKL